MNRAIAHQLTAFTLFCLAISQVHGQTEWTRQFGTPLNDDPRAISANTTGIYVLYRVSGAQGDVEFLRKLSLAGNLIWEVPINPGASVRPAGLASDDAGVFIVGSVNGTLPGQTNAGYFDAFLLRYDGGGNLQWSRQFGTPHYDDAAAVAVDASGVYVVGNSAGILPNQTSAGGVDGFLYKFDANGNSLWIRQFGTDSTDAARAVAAGGTVVHVSGWVGGSFPGQASAGGGDAFVRKYDSDGTLLWTRQFGSPAFDNPASLAIQGSSVYVAGTTGGSLAGQTSAGAEDAFVRKYQENGDAEWTRQFGSSFYEFANAVSADGTGVYVGGSTGGILPGQTGGGGSLFVPDGFIQKYDPSGNLQWTRQFGSPGNDRVEAVFAGNGRLLIAASTTGALSGANSGGSDVFVQSIEVQTGLRFVPLSPCRVVDTRQGQGTTGPFGPPTLLAMSTRTIPIPEGRCGIPAGAQAYSFNVTVVPQEPLGYLTLWPAGLPQPFVSTLNSFHGGVVANAAIVPAGAGGAVSAFVTNPTDLILDINGYFTAESSPQALSFYPLNPCRVVDTRGPFTGAFGPPSLAANATRSFPLPDGSCVIPGWAAAHSLNATVVPAQALSYLTLWPTGQPQPFVSTLNSFDGTVVANAAIVPAGTNGAISAFATDKTDLILDTNGFFGASGNPGERTFRPVTPCRVADTRLEGSGGQMFGRETRDFAIGGTCGVPANAKWYSLNVTVVPAGPLSYLSLWPTGTAQPVVSTLNSFLGRVVANAALVPAGLNGAVSVFVTDSTHVILDINGYFQ